MSTRHDWVNNKSNSQNLDLLIQLYQNAGKNQFALFVGSGVNGGDWAAIHPACASWPKLLRQASKHFHSESRIEAILGAGNSDWINLAGELFRGQNRETVIRKIDEAIYAGVFHDPTTRASRQKKHKVLPWTVLKKMDTLRAAVCFSAAINDPSKKRSMRRNPKVGRVLTTNYDFFFGAAWPRYTSMSESWWPVTWKSSEPLPEGVGEILYLHGYLPYSGRGERDVILTREDYTRAYAEEGFTRQELIEACRQFNLLFLGFSFSDILVCKILQNYGHTKEHFAILHESELPAIESAQAAGVLPITVRSWGQLPQMLGNVYCAGLTIQELDRTGMAESQDYWGDLQSGLEPRT
jgi:hypothetical protein